MSETEQAIEAIKHTIFTELIGRDLGEEWEILRGVNDYVNELGRKARAQAEKLKAEERKVG